MCATQKAFNSLLFFLFFFSLCCFWTNWQNFLAHKLFLNQSECNQDRKYYDDMLCAFISSALEINSNGGLKWEHVESCPSATENVFLLTQCLWPLNFVWWWSTMRGSQPKVTQPFDHLILGDHVINWKLLPIPTAYGHETWKDGSLSLWAPSHKVTEPFDQMVV